MPVGAVASVVSAGVGLFGASKAADAQEDAAKKAAKQQDKMHKQARADLEPYREGGKSAFYSLNDMYGLARPGSTGGEAFQESQLEAFRRSPDYQVALKEGIRATDMSAAARGNLLSGGHMKRIQELGSDIGSRYFGSYMDRLAQIAGIGQNSAAGSASNAMSHGARSAEMSLAAGEAKASGYVGMANAVNGAIGNGMNNMMTYKYLQNGGGGSGGPTNILPKMWS